MKFKWDVRKNRINRQKHGLSFETAARVFLDDNRIELYDLEHSAYEDRYIILGYVNEILFVVYTVRDEFIRIISARKATAKERDLYYYGKNNEA